MFRKNILSDSNESNISKLMLSPPQAESTHIDQASRQSFSKYPWGGKLTPKRKATSPLHNSRAIVKLNNSSPVFSKKIDPQIYTDVQSRGLASRIVKYHELSKQQNERQSLQSNYTKPGQFPIVNLNSHKQLPYSPKRNGSRVSTIKIAPPDRSISSYNIQPTKNEGYHLGGRLLNLNNLQKNDSERIILSNDNEIVTTRSAIDALAEISRKRINNEEFHIDSINKKTCIEDEIDSPPVLGNNNQNLQYKKRTRDSTVSPPKLDNLHLNKKNCVVQKQISKNNDILSSLSSSIIFAPSAKEQQRDKVVQQNNCISALQKTQHSRLPIQIHPNQNKEQVQNLVENHVITGTIIPSKTTVTAADVLSSTHPKIILFNRIETNPKVIKNNNSSYNDTSLHFVKPKTLANENSLAIDDNNSNKSKSNLTKVEKSKLAMMLSCLCEDENDDDYDSDGGKDMTDHSTSKTVDVGDDVSKEVPVPVLVNKIMDKPDISPVIISTAASTSLIQTITSSIPSISTNNTTFSFGLTKPNIPILTTTVSSEIINTTITPTVTLSLPKSEAPQINFGNFTSKVQFNSNPITSVTPPTVTSTIIPTITSSHTIPIASTLTLTSTSLSKETLSPPRVGGFKFVPPTTTLPNTETVNKPNFMIASPISSSNTNDFTFGMKPIVNPTTSEAPSKFSFFNQANVTTVEKSQNSEPNVTFGTNFWNKEVTGPTKSSSNLTFVEQAPPIAKSEPAPPTFSFGSSTPMKPNPVLPFEFNSTPITTIASTFGTITSIVPPIPDKPPANIQNNFVFGDTVSKAETVPMFGTKPVTNSLPPWTETSDDIQPEVRSTFSFGNTAHNATNNSKPIFGSASATTTINNNTTFSFKNSTPAIQMSNNMDSNNSGFKLGGTATSTPSNIFGSAQTNTSMNNNVSNVFGATTKVFGNNDIQPKPALNFALSGLANNKSPSTFSFSGTTVPLDQPTSILNSGKSTTEIQSVFGGTGNTNNVPSFNSTTIKQTTSAPQFGSNTTSSSNTFSFTVGNTTNANNPFGGATQQANPTLSTNLFGGGIQASSTFGGFSSKTDNKPESTGFNFTGNQQASNTQQQPSSTVFSFNSNSNNNSPAPSPMFGGSATTNFSINNVFGGSNGTTNASSGFANNNAATNLFNIGPGGTSTGRRPIRTATRRLK